jgi:bifunctional non-homologous end joining protein LigD
MKSIVLYYSDLATGGNSDKEYRIQVVKNGSGYVVQFQFGRRDSTLQSSTKTNEPVTLEEAERIFDRLVHEKTSKGYQLANGKTAAAPAMLEKADAAKRTPYPIEALEEISREAAEKLVKSPKHWMQRKLDGERRQMEKFADGTILSYNKKGNTTDIPQPTRTDLAEIPLDSFLLDGELIGDVFTAFDILRHNGRELGKTPYRERFHLLCEVVNGERREFVKTVATWTTTRSKQAALAELLESRAEGVVFKQIDAQYRAGIGEHTKFKFLKSASCKVIGMGIKGHNNASLALLDHGKWREVGRVSLNGKDSRIKIGSIVEVIFLYVGAGGRLYQPRVKQLRFDVAESECTFSQLKNAFKEGIAA